MKDLKTKGRVIKTRKAANSPAPGPCGHSHCGEVCRVRYIGAVTSIRDHHIMHVARGISHVWTATIIAGLAVVLTGAVAFSSVNAANQNRDDVRTAQSTSLILDKMQSIESRLNALENQFQQMSARQQAQNSPPASIRAVFPASERP